MKTNFKLLGLVSCVALSAAATSAYAFDVRELNDLDASRAPAVLRSQGYDQVGTKYDDGKLWVLFFNRDSRDCVGYVEKKGRAKKARSFDNHVCRENRDSSYVNHDRHGDRDGYGGHDSGDVPGWMVGYFRGHNRGSDVSLNISRDGTVVATVDGKPVYGQYRNGKLRMGMSKFYVDRDDDGLTTRQDGDESNVVHYRRR